jgi:vanillate O-demethylase monooxygenase subunit
VRKHAIGIPAVDELFFAQVSEAFEEDRQVLEAQQKSLSEYGDSWDVTLQADAGCFQSRRLLTKLIEAETAGV